MLAPLGILNSRVIQENPQKERRRKKKAPPRKQREPSQSANKRDGEHIDITA